MGIPFLDRVRARYGLKLAVAFTAVLLLTVGVGTVVSADASTQLRDDVESHMVGTADQRADRLDTWLTGVTTQARVASDHPALRSDDREAVTASLDELASDDRAPPGVVATHYVDADTSEATLVVESEPTLRADEARLRRLLENLFRNSVEHGSTDNRRGSAGDSVEHGSTDTPPDDGDVFEAGYTTDSEGTGLGLAIVERIAREHGWSIDAVEADGGGARFEFRG